MRQGMLRKMKIWLKYLIAIAAGLMAGTFIPFPGGGALDTIVELSLNLARYILVPLTFFSAIVGAHELHEEHRFGKTFVRAMVHSVVIVVAGSAVGTLGALVASTRRIPLSNDPVTVLEPMPDVGTTLLGLLPADGVTSLLSGGFLLPVIVFAFTIGLALSFDRMVTKPSLALFDSLSRVFWHINNAFMEILTLPLIVVAAARAVMLGGNERLGVYGWLIALIVAEAAFFVFGLLPLLMFILDRRHNPYKVLAAFAAPALVSLTFGHTYAQGGVALRHLKESLGVRRRSSAVVMPVALALGRAGTAMVTATIFVAVINSYSSLGLDSSTIVWMMVWVPLATLLLGAAPAAGPVVALGGLCAAYGRGFESGYVLLVPAMLPLTLLAAFVDAIMVAGITTSVAGKADDAAPKSLRHFI